MVEIPTNTTKNSVIEKTIDYIVKEFKTKDYVQITRSDINEAQAYEIGEEFFKKGYHYEIREHSNNYGHVFFYCLNVSKTKIRSNDARFAWTTICK